MDFKRELSKYGYNIGNSIDVEILVSEILPEIFETLYTKDDVIKILEKFIEHPTKPGYKRSDVVKFIKELKK